MRGDLVLQRHGDGLDHLARHLLEVIPHPAVRWMLPGFHDPVWRAAGTIGGSRCFETSPIRQACRNKSAPISPLSKSLRKITSTRRGEGGIGLSCASIAAASEDPHRR